MKIETRYKNNRTVKNFEHKRRLKALKRQKERQEDHKLKEEIRQQIKNLKK